ncbi:hypothetical protein BgiMline_031590 [Biomphalaria glabrata]|nr:hypothetical protein BgiMline_019804 [Biomphalaria glabrata]
MGLGQAKFDYGTHETAEFKSDDVAEAEIQRDGCQKNHSNYLEVKGLTLDSLPQGYQEPDLLELVKSLASLTVRISVMYSSLERRKFWQGTEASYPGYICRGSDTCLTGSGRICDVYEDTKYELTCPCSDCKEPMSGSERRAVWHIWVYSATHVVYNSVEAEKSVFKLFYDTSEGKRKTFYGVKVLWSNITGDLCLLSCVTCDKELADELDQSLKGLISIWKRIRENYKRDKTLEDDARKYKDRIVVIVSHPHGGPKKVSFGQLHSKERKKIGSDNGWHINYLTNTCSGSSGAPVYLYGMDWFKSEYVHSGSNSDVNYSTTWSPEEK